MKLSDITEQDALKIADTSAIYERGESYYRSGKVTNMQIEHDAIYAVVKGNYADYQVQIAVGVNGLNYDCDCPYDGWGCKHIVAVVLLFANHKEKLLSESQKTTEGEILKETLLKLKKAELVDIIAEAAKLHSPFRRQLMMRFDLHTETVINELTKEIEKAFSDVGAAPLCPPVGAVSGCSRVDTPNNGVVATICGRPYYHPKRIARKLEKIYSSVKGQSVKIRYRIASEILNATLNELSDYDIPQEHLSNLAIDMMQEIVKLFSEQNLPRDEKLKLMDNLTTHYASCDCSLAEHIADTLLELCLTEEDYNYLVERLKHDKNLTLKLYQLMGDDETYLAERKKHLVYVADYWDLCQYYQKRGQEDDAVKTATDGVEKAQGNPLVLIEFLCSFYNRQKNYNEQIRYLMMKFEYKPSFSTYKSLLTLCENRVFALQSVEKQREIQNQCCQLLQNHNIGDKKLLGQIYLHHKDYERLHKFVKKNPQYASDFADEKVIGANSIDSLLGYEGSASAAYFGVFRRFLRNDFGFTTRQHRPPPDPINALLSLGYTMLYNNTFAMVNVVGLDPYCGFFHQPKHGHATLASDLMEEFRAIIVDSMVLELANHNRIASGDFLKTDKGIRLSKGAFSLFLSTYNTRMNRPFNHPQLNVSTNYLRAIELQARQLTRVIRGEENQYLPFKPRS